MKQKWLVRVFENGQHAYNESFWTRTLAEKGATMTKLKIGDYVEAGTGDDHDTGHIIALLPGGMARVAWDSQVRTVTPMSDLQPLKPCRGARRAGRCPHCGEE